MKLKYDKLLATLCFQFQLGAATTREDQASTFPNGYGDIHYAARRVAAVKVRPGIINVIW